MLTNVIAGRPRKGASRPWLVRYGELYPGLTFLRYGEIANHPKDSRISGKGLLRQVKMGVSSSV
jgi:hypothetical protein